MRFAYIDSQDKEVSIPGVDGLRLRIELGAIADDTMFYDGAADRWAPAVEHEIFRTLKRELAGRGSGDYVAPPAEDGAPPLMPDPFEALDGPVETPHPEDRDEFGAGSEPEPAPSPEGESVPDYGEGDWDLGIDLTLNEGMEGSGPPGTWTAGSTGGDSGEARSGAGDPEAGSADRSDGPSDGGSGGGSDGRSDDGSDGGSDGDVGEVGQPEELREDFGFGLDLEPSLAEYTAEDLPSWMSGGEERHRDPDEPPAWTRGTESTEGPDYGGPGEAPSPGAGEAGAAGGPPDDEFPDRESVRRKLEARKAEAARGSLSAPGSMDTGMGTASGGGAGPQRRPVKKRRNRGSAVIAAAGLALVAAAGWFGVQVLSGDREEEMEEPAVEIPEIADRLEPRLRSLSLRATQEMVEGLQSLPEREAVPPEPDPDWLGGRYMATVSRYQGVPDYWRNVLAWVEAMRAAEEPLFMAAYRSEVEAEGLTADDEAALIERGEAGFQAAARDRSLVYDQLEQVGRAALSLHTFLEANEGDIDYEPASGGLSRDPVLEAVPASEELGDEMWARVGEITDALDALGLLDRVTTDRLAAVFFEKLAATPIR